MQAEEISDVQVVEGILSSDQVVECILPSDPDTPPIVMTRYLYDYAHVKQSLIWALLDHQRDESLFWTYEMYFSGFCEETFQLLWETYVYLYQELNPNLAPILLHLYRQSENDETMIGSWVLHLLEAPISLTYNMREKRNITIVPSSKSLPTNDILPSVLSISTTEINQYRTVTSETGGFPAWKILRIVCRFTLRSEQISENTSDALETPVYESTTSINSQGRTVHRKHRVPPSIEDRLAYEQSSEAERDDVGSDEGTETSNSRWCSWEYYASFSPIWAERIHEFRGYICHETKQIHFDDEDDLEDFHTKYGLEPDEQPRHVQESILPPCSYKYISWKLFYKMYGSTSCLRKVILRRDHQGNMSGTWI